jgi:dipeptidyl aminopeptidase/acylaminoacyl peptidase
VPGSNGAIVTSKCDAADGTCGSSHIWAIDPESGAERPVTGGASWWDYDPAVSPDGSRVAFQRCSVGEPCRIAIVGLGGGAVTELTAGGDYEDSPAFSPDGGKLVFSRSDPAGGAHLIVTDAAGGDERALTSGSGYDQRPSWSPDGSAIVFERHESGVGTHIRKVAASGGPTQRLTAGSADHAPDFSPDGARIAFAGSGAIRVMRADGSDPRALTAPGGDLEDGEPAFAPDGTQIVFRRFSDHVPHASPLLVMDADGSGEHLISGPTELLGRAAWQPLLAAALGPPAADDRAPGVTLAAPRRQSVRRGLLHVTATSDEPATGSASGRVAIAGIARRYRLRTAAVALPANAGTRIGLTVPREPLRAIRAALVRHERPRARILVTVEDGAGNAATRTLIIRVKR